MTQQPDEERPTVHFKGPGQWRSYADDVQDGEPEDDQADEDTDSLATQLRQQDA